MRRFTIRSLADTPMGMGKESDRKKRGDERCRKKMRREEDRGSNRTPEDSGHGVNGGS